MGNFDSTDFEESDESDYYLSPNNDYGDRSLEHRERIRGEKNNVGADFNSLNVKKVVSLVNTRKSIEREFWEAEPVDVCNRNSWRLSSSILLLIICVGILSFAISFL